MFVLSACSPSPLIASIPDLKTCNNSDLVIAFDFKISCAKVQNEFVIVVYHHFIEDLRRVLKHPPFIQINDTTCRVHTTLEGVTVDEYNSSILQVQMREIKIDRRYCSNNFSLLVYHSGKRGVFY